ncbi:hypothetical protein Avbf_07328 [Armadillidium vulgare]|nr:hypothetical protein Avbf_07328 [Armadillidium vulgare]
MLQTTQAILYFFLLGITLALAKNSYQEEPVEENTEEEAYEAPDEDYEEKRPYSFAWKASRYYNGAPDREHIEERNEDGITRGVYRFVDPRQEIQEVVYHSDDTGFHVQASNLPQDTPAVSAAKQSHLQLFRKIKEDHERLAKELEDKPKEEQE